MVAIFLTVYICLDLGIFMYVSKMNKSLFNAYTVEIANEILVRLLPFLLMIKSYYKFGTTLFTFCFILYISTIFKYIGYYLGYRTRILNFRIKRQKYATSKYSFMLKCTVVIGIIAFLLLGYSGVGILTWITDSRKAYMTGRTGNGIYYVLFQLSIIVAAILILCITYWKRRKSYLYMYIGGIVASYFTGSKMMILGIIVIYLFYRDMFVKTLNMKKTIILGIGGLLGIVLLMRIQSNINLLDYSDYYSNFLRLLQYSKGEEWSFYQGKILGEKLFWSVIPRAIYSGKPHIYGYSRIINLFYHESIIIAGNTPSFSQFAVPYADFGILGICLEFLCKGYFSGFLERYLRDDMKRNGITFNIFFTYCICFIASPLNFGILFFVIFLLGMNMVQRIKCSIKMKL